MREPNQRGLSNEDQLKEKIIDTGGILGKHGLVTFLGSYAPGNISARVPDSQRVLITPSGLAKNTLRKREICVIDLNGKLIGGTLRPTSETPTHLAVYRRRSDVNAIIHTHPTYSTAFAIAKKKNPCSDDRDGRTGWFRCFCGEIFRPRNARTWKRSCKISKERPGRLTPEPWSNHSGIDAG
jgi:L-ribulose-5-phosphate 4-epimerase